MRNLFLLRRLEQYKNRIQQQITIMIMMNKQHDIAANLDHWILECVECGFFLVVFVALFYRVAIGMPTHAHTQ